MFSVGKFKQKTILILELGFKCIKLKFYVILNFNKSSVWVTSYDVLNGIRFVYLKIINQYMVNFNVIIDENEKCFGD